jgi:hypothetical protein
MRQAAVVTGWYAQEAASGVSGGRDEGVEGLWEQLMVEVWSHPAACLPLPGHVHIGWACSCCETH